MELEKQHPPPQEKDNTSTKQSLVEATAIEVLDDRPQQQQQQQQPQEGVVIHHHIVSSPTPSVRNDNDVIQCCYPITTNDPAEVTQARDVAVIHICVELIVAALFCSSEWCGTIPFVAVLSSGPVACCSKHRITYRIWSCTGAVLCVVHAIIAAEITSIEGSYSWSPVVLSMQIFLCCVSLVVVYRGCKTASAMRQPVCPVENQLLEMPMGAPTHPVAETQHTQVSRMLP